MVATPVGVNRDIVIEGRTGFQADAPEAWRKALVALARDPGLRAELGRNAREHVEARFSLRAWARPLPRPAPPHRALRILPVKRLNPPPPPAR